MENNNTPVKKPSLFMRYKTFFIMLALIIIIVSWALIKITVTENRYSKEKADLIHTYETRIDSLTRNDMETTLKVFSWAIRSEMIRGNMEQINQFFISFVRENNNIARLTLIDPKTGKVLTSTDKIEEENTITDNQILNITNIVWHGNKVAAPVMGLNDRIGVLLVELR